MDSVNLDPIASTFHIVALPYPGRGHINPMMNLCKLLSSKKPELLISFVVTEEWLGFIGSQIKPQNIRFQTIPNVIPSEIGRANDFPGFIEAVSLKTEAPFEELLDRLEPAVNLIVADTYLVWTTGLANRRNIPLASLWTMSATVFSELHHFELLRRHGHSPLDLLDRRNEIVDYIPGVSPTRVADLLHLPNNTGSQIVLSRALEAINSVQKAQYLLFTSFFELEPHTIQTLKSKFPFPVYSIGPSIPYLEKFNQTSTDSDSDYIRWLNSQPEKSILYISFGSFLSTSKSQVEEFVAGVKNSNVRYLWVARGYQSPMNGGGDGGDLGFVVPWCDQLRVLCHSSIGGFWSHCGWNSVLESVHAGIPMLASPIFWDQIPNSKLIAEDWKIGLRVKGDIRDEKLVSRDEIAELVKRFMDGESDEGKEMRKRTKELQEKCQQAIAKGGSSDSNIDEFMKNIMKNP